MSINHFRLYGGSNREAKGIIDVSVVEADAVEETAEVVATEEAPTPLPVPTAANKKAEIIHYLMYEHGVDPDDLDMKKDELLSLAKDLAEHEKK